MQEITITPLEALAQLTAIASLIDTFECKDNGIYNRLQGALGVAQTALAMVPKQEAPHSMAFIGLANSDQFKYVLEQLATGQPNPKERRRLVREVRDTIKLCADSQIKESAETLSVRDWIKVEDRLPEPYEEVRILFDGVPRIARLCHNRKYFQLATFIDSTKSQYIATFDKVDGWMPIALAPANSAAPAAANGALPELPEDAAGSCEVITGHETIRGMQGDIVEYHEAYSADQMRAYGQACHALGRGDAVREYVENGTFKQPVAAAGPDTALIKALEDITEMAERCDSWESFPQAPIDAARAALSGAKGN